MPKISALNEITNPEPDDILAGVEDSDETTKYVKISTLLKFIYPVGSIYTNATDDTNPATLFGFGTWVPFAEGRVPMGFKGDDVDVDTAEKTGGAKSHWHWQTVGTDGGAGYISVFGSSSGGRTKVIVDNRVAFSVNSQAVGFTRYDGTEDASSLPPYVTVYMWKRTA